MTMNDDCPDCQEEYTRALAELTATPELRAAMREVIGWNGWIVDHQVNAAVAGRSITLADCAYVIVDLLSCCELNLDEMEPETVKSVERARAFADRLKDQLKA